MTFIDICAGIGGFSLGLEWTGMTCKGQVEIDEYCNKILAKHWPNVPRWGDLKTLEPSELPAVDLIAGGYPCQPFSNAGKRKGTADDRHLWPYIRAIVAHLRPTWCLFENVAGHITLGLDAVLSDLEGGGYTCWPLIIPACAVGAPHQRDRTWIIAHADSFMRELRQVQKYGKADRTHGKPLTTKKTYSLTLAQRIFRSPDSSHIRRGDGIPHRMDRVKGLGNAVVPQVVYEIGSAIVAANDN